MHITLSMPYNVEAKKPKERKYKMYTAFQEETFNIPELETLSVAALSLETNSRNVGRSNLQIFFVDENQQFFKPLSLHFPKPFSSFTSEDDNALSLFDVDIKSVMEDSGVFEAGLDGYYVMFSRKLMSSLLSREDLEQMITPENDVFRTLYDARLLKNIPGHDSRNSYKKRGQNFYPILDITHDIDIRQDNKDYWKQEFQKAFNTLRSTSYGIMREVDEPSISFYNTISGALSSTGISTLPVSLLSLYPEFKEKLHNSQYVVSGPSLTHIFRPDVFSDVETSVQKTLFNYIKILRGRSQESVYHDKPMPQADASISDLMGYVRDAKKTSLTKRMYEYMSTFIEIALKFDGCNQMNQIRNQQVYYGENHEKQDRNFKGLSF